MNKDIHNTTLSVNGSVVIIEKYYYVRKILFQLHCIED